MCFHTDGKTLASGGEDRAIKLWDLSTGQARRSMTGHTNLVWCLAFSPKSRTLVSAGADNQIIVWDPVQATRRSALAGHTQVVSGLAFAPDGRMLYSASHDGTVRMWRGKQPPATPEATIDTYASASGEKPKSGRGPYQNYRALALSPDGKLLAAGFGGSAAHVFDVVHRVERRRKGEGRDSARRLEGLGPGRQARVDVTRRPSRSTRHRVCAKWQTCGGRGNRSLGKAHRNNLGKDRARLQGAHGRGIRRCVCAGR